ncbi:MAG: GMC family oxidoreductase [Bdellovibrionota bacterium]
MAFDADVCIVGSGAGGGPVAYSLAQAGYSVIVLEKGPYLSEKDFFKDEIGEAIRSKFRPFSLVEPRVIRRLPEDEDGKISSIESLDNNLWNATMVGGSTNIMSGFFFRMKPKDFALRSLLGSVKNGNVEDWPINYQDLEPYYSLAEKVIGISGRQVSHPQSEPRSSPDFPYPPVAEHPLAHWVDHTAKDQGWYSLPVARAILSQTSKNRGACSYTGMCGMYGCTTGAKGSSRVALLEPAVATGRCEIRAEATVKKINMRSRKIVEVEYFDKDGSVKFVKAKMFVLAAQAIETARLLLLSASTEYPNGLANSSGQVGKNLFFSVGGGGSGQFSYAKYSGNRLRELRNPQPFLNRAFQDWYFYEQGEKKYKGGTLLFLLDNPSPILSAMSVAFENKNSLLWGEQLAKSLKSKFVDSKTINFETFADGIPHPKSHVTLDASMKDRFGLPVAKVQVKTHKNSIAATKFLKEKGRSILQAMGAENIKLSPEISASANLVAGTCRFGNNPRTSVLNADCRAHDVDNLYVTDGSFIPSGGSVPFTWTIYANAFRVADKIIQQLGGLKKI